MSDLTASGHFAGGASADLHSLTRAIAHRGNHLRHGQLKRRHRTVPEDWFDRLTEQSGRFAAVGRFADERAAPEPFADMPDGEATFALPDIADFDLHQPLIDETPVAQKTETFWWGGSFVSVTLHGIFAVLILSLGLHVELPQVEGETAVAVTIIGDAAFDDLASGDNAEDQEVAELTDPVPPVAPDMPKTDKVLELAEKTVALSAPQLRIPAKPTEQPPAPMTTMQPAKTSVSPVPEFPKPLETKPPVAKAAPKPQKSREVRTPKPVATKQKSKEKAQAKEAAVKPAVTKAKSAKAAGKAGSGKADSRKGAADGAEKGQATSKSAGKSAGKTGNATASNYPGLVQRKIARTRKKSGSGKGNVVISFSITTSGGLGSVSVARSSGTSSVDAAALDHVRRSAPFPAPPAGAQTRFQIPVTIR